AEEAYMYNDDGTLKTAVNAHVRYDYTYTPDGKLAAKYRSEPQGGTLREERRPKWFQGTQSGQGADGASGRRRTLHNAIPTEHGFKHVKAKTADEAELFSKTGKKHAQYLPGVNNKGLEKEALWKGEIVDGDKGVIYFIYDTGRPIGFDLGTETSWIRAEITSGKVYHGHPISGNRLEEDLKKSKPRKNS
ncbi:hypothetical protein LQV63_31455, partial [Paenibacillus profundus]|nr:hypothetical protein [Paenibacillus profundus]